MIVSMFNSWHFVWILIYTGMFACFYFGLRNKAKQQQGWFIYGLILVNFVIHFAAPAMVASDMADFTFRISLRNICAVLVFVSPFLFWQRDHFLKPGWLYASMIGGFVIFINPTDAIGYHPFSFDVIRFFIQHGLLFTVVVLLISFNHEQLRWQDIWTTPVVMILVIVIVIANNAILQVIGVLEDMRRSNAAFQWHPSFLEAVFGWAIPSVFRTIPFGEHAGTQGYWPLFYKLPLFAIGFPLVSAGINGINIGLRKIKHSKDKD